MIEVEWRQFRDTRYQVSFFGDVRAVWYEGRSIRPVKVINGKITIKGKRFTVRRMIAEAFGTQYVHGNALLSAEDITNIKQAFADVVPGHICEFYDKKAAEYGVSAGQIRHIVAGRRR